MNMKRRITIFLLLFLFVPTLLFAQSLTNRERRQINSQVLALIEEYERYASLYDDEAEHFFRSLFKDDAQIVSDMIGSPSYLKSVSISEYINQLRVNSVNTATAIMDVRKGQLKFENGEWHIPIAFRKSLTYIDKNNYVFSIENYYSRYFNVTMDLVYDENENRCMIASMSGRVDSDKVFPEGRFYIINKPRSSGTRYAKHFETLKIDSKPIEYNSTGQAMVVSGEPSVDDVDVEVSVVNETEGFNYDVVSFMFKTRNIRLKPYFSYAPFSAYVVENAAEYMKDESTAMAAGLDFGVTFPAGRHCKMGFYFGAGVSKSTLTLSLDNTTLTYNYDVPLYDKTNMAFHNNTYKYTISNAMEQVEYMDLYVPLYLDFEFSLGREVLLSFNFGAKAYLNMSAKPTTPYSVEYKVNNVANPSDGVAGSVFTPTSFIVPNSYAKKSFDISGIANLGLDINLFKKRIYLMLQGGYEYGVTNSYESPTSQYGASEVKPIVPELNASGDAVANHVAVNSLISGLETKRRAIWLTTGLKFKL